MFPVQHQDLEAQAPQQKMTKLLQRGVCPYLQRCASVILSTYMRYHKIDLPFLFLFFYLNELVLMWLLIISYQELDLSGLGVTSVPAAAWETSDVMKLDLSKNLIEDLPNELSLCSSLQVCF